MRTHFNKLVRDRIPEIIRAESRECGTETLSDGEYRAALKEKLVEEAQEASEATRGVGNVRLPVGDQREGAVLLKQQGLGIERLDHGLTRVACKAVELELGQGRSVVGPQRARCDQRAGRAERVALEHPIRRRRTG